MEVLFGFFKDRSDAAKDGEPANDDFRACKPLPAFYNLPGHRPLEGMVPVQRDKTKSGTLDDAELQGAIEATFARRQTAMPSAMPIGLSDAFADDPTKQEQWRAFPNKGKLEPMDLRDVVRTISERAMRFGFTGT